MAINPEITDMYPRHASQIEEFRKLYREYVNIHGKVSPETFYTMLDQAGIPRQPTRQYTRVSLFRRNIDRV